MLVRVPQKSAQMGWKAISMLETAMQMQALLFHRGRGGVETPVQLQACCNGPRSRTRQAQMHAERLQMHWLCVSLGL